jgi:hypothetical protein
MRANGRKLATKPNAPRGTSASNRDGTKDSSMLELYHHGSSVCAAKVRLTLAEKGLDRKSHYVDILKGEQFDPAYMRLNPKAVVSTLIP